MAEFKLDIVIGAAMADELSTAELRAAADELAARAAAYFARANDAPRVVPRPSRNFTWEKLKPDHYWANLPDLVATEALDLVQEVFSIAARLAVFVKVAPLASEADQRDVMTATKAMRAALLLRRFHHWDAEVLHDEGTVLGVHPAGQSDDEASPPEDAERTFAQEHARIRAILQLVEATAKLSTAPATLGSSTTSSRYRLGTAFIMMWMDKSRRELDDVADTVKSVFDAFDVRAIRADDIEHEELITKRILDEIATAEFLSRTSPVRGRAFTTKSATLMLSASV